MSDYQDSRDERHRKRRESRERSTHKDSRISNVVSVVLGSSFVVCTLVLCILGTNAMMSSMNRQMQETIAEAKKSVSSMSVDNRAKVDSDDSFNRDTSNDGWTSDQIEWMIKNHITYYNGKPYDEFGHVVDDPTTAENEVDAVGNFKDSVSHKPNDSNGSDNNDLDSDSSSEPSDKPSKDEPEISPNWWDGNDFVLLDEDGSPYYVIKRGDSLSKVAKMTGFTVHELAVCNKIPDEHLIFTGEIIRFPDKLSSVDASGIDLKKGLG